MDETGSLPSADWDGPAIDMMESEEAARRVISVTIVRG
jgi:hypothetical protein